MADFHNKYRDRSRLYSALKAIAGSGDYFIPLGLLPKEVSFMIDGMELQGFVERGKHPRYTLARAYRLAEAGRQKLEELQTQE